MFTDIQGSNAEIHGEKYFGAGSNRYLLEFGCYQCCWGGVYVHVQGKRSFIVSEISRSHTNSQVPGVSATSIWDDMPLDKKKNTIRQVAQNLYKLWPLRFDAIGSLYLDKDGNDFTVGPIVENHFVHKSDGAFRISKPIDLNEFRGPFTSITSYLQSGLRSELKLYAERREDLVIGAEDESACVEYGRTAMEKAEELCRLYPGDKPLTNDTKEPISLMLQDFRLANVMVNSFLDSSY